MTASLVERLPPVRGKITPQAPLAGMTWFRVGGPAEILFRPADLEDLQTFLAALPEDVPVTLLGVASNLLIRDGGVDGVVIRLGRAFAEITVHNTTLVAGAGALDSSVAQTAQNAGLAGLEFLSGIPGTIGGGLRMNAGAYGSEMKDVLISALAIDRQGKLHEVAPADFGFAYRRSSAPADWIFLRALLSGRAERQNVITERMATINARRQQTQPVRARTGGSTFTNPGEVKAWQLIDRAGCRGLRRGGAMVAELHANFLVNTGDATAADIEGLGEEVRRRVLETSGVSLEWEIRRIGRPLAAGGPA
jgi:UDP-N-acetylmuramate dehydrogenase